jgi:hypothetical protein
MISFVSTTRRAAGVECETGGRADDVRVGSGNWHLQGLFRQRLSLVHFHILLNA